MVYLKIEGTPTYINVCIKKLLKKDYKSCSLICQSMMSSKKKIILLNENKKKLNVPSKIHNIVYCNVLRIGFGI